MGMSEFCFAQYVRPGWQSHFCWVTCDEGKCGKKGDEGDTQYIAADDVAKSRGYRKEPQKKTRKIETAQFDAATRVIVKKVKVKPSDEIVCSYSFESETAL